ncbi:MAG: SpoIIIAH-like family protein [Ruthenibacterium sp.]
MKKIWKRNAVVATVLLFVCAAVYLNWRYAGNVAETGTKILGKSTLVSSDAGDSASEDAASEDAAADAAAEDDYFATARLTRQQARDSALALLHDASDEENTDDSIKNQASEGIQALAGYTLQEAQIENLVTAKGYADCIAFMGEDSISIVVPGDALASTDVAKIKDIAISETGYKAEQIKILQSN